MKISDDFYLCNIDECGMWFTTEKQLENHVRKFHKEVKMQVDFVKS
jgi:hypothetical protein